MGPISWSVYDWDAFTALCNEHSILLGAFVGFEANGSVVSTAPDADSVKKCRS
jgi:hypothetical protein